MDNLNQLGKNLNKNNKISKRALDKKKQIIPQIERVRDTMDFMVPFEIEFAVLENFHRIQMSLDFMPPPGTGCCADCACAVCEFFDGGISETLYQLTYAYVPGTVHVFINDTEITHVVETNPTLGEVTTYAHNDDKVVICYVYDICL